MNRNIGTKSQATGTKKAASKPIETLTLGEVESLLSSISTTSVYGLRDRALILVMHHCGLRVAEALALLPKDVDHENYLVRILRGKGSKPRTVPIDPLALSALRLWNDRRAQLGFNGSHTLFCSLTGKRLARQHVDRMLRRTAKDVGLLKRVHAHGLRHSSAAHLMRENVHPEHIRRFLGHSSLQTTMVYLSGLGDQETMETIRAVDWSRR